MIAPESQDQRPSRNRRLAVVAVVAGVLVVAAAVGAYLDWMWWEPYRGLTITLAAGAALVVALILLTARRTRPAALVVAVVAVGLLVGQNFGPSRAMLELSEGTLAVTLTSPRATTGSIPVTCQMDAAATELQVSGDPNLRLDIFPDDPAAPADVDQREFVSVTAYVGDRWQRVEGRSDTKALLIGVGRVEADLPETRLRADDSSTLEIGWTADGGTARFSGLVRDMTDPTASGDMVDLEGSMEWTC